MKKKILTLLIIFLTFVLSASADFEFSDEFDSTGDSFFDPYYEHQDTYQRSKKHISNPTIPPIKMLRLNIQNKLDENAAKKMEFAPTIEEESIYASDTGTSDYASKEQKDNFEEMPPDGFEADEEAVE